MRLGRSGLLEALLSDRTDAEIARAYEVHPVTLSNWKKKLKEDGAKAFGGDNELREKEKKIASLERMCCCTRVSLAWYPALAQHPPAFISASQIQLAETGDK